MSTPFALTPGAFAQALRDEITQYHTAHPIPQREQLTPEQEWQCQVIGGELISWLEGPLMHIMGQRQILSKLRFFDSEPLILFSTTPAGLVAAQTIFETASDRVIFLDHGLWQQFSARYSEAEYAGFVVHHWSYFSDQISPRAQAHAGQAPRKSLRVHTAGEWWGERCGLEARHLWSFQNDSGHLLEEAFDTRSF